MDGFLVKVNSEAGQDLREGVVEPRCSPPGEQKAERKREKG